MYVDIIRKPYFVLFFANSIRSVLARKIEEYVPTTSPIERTRAKAFVVSGPKKKSARTTNKVVSEVFTDLVIVSFKEIPTTSTKSLEAFLRRFSLILSNTTIVSFTESPKIARRADTKRAST